MSACVRHVCFSLLVLYGIQAHSFENLDFEQAMPISTGDEFDICCNQPVVDILPGWTAFDLIGSPTLIPNGGWPLESAYHNSFHIGGSPGIFNLFGGSIANNHLPAGPTEPVSGTYSLQLIGTYAGAALSQVGTLPDGTKSILFSGLFRNGTPPVDHLAETIPSEIPLFLGGVELEVQKLTDSEGYNTFGANIPDALVGQQVELRFVVPPMEQVNMNGVDTYIAYEAILDDIQFSPIPVPEPASLMIGALGCGIAAACRPLHRQ